MLETSAVHDIIVIGASAGGVEAISRIVAELPENLPASIFVVMHFPAHSTSAFPEILSRRGKIPAVHARHGEPIRKGRIYVGPPDYHMLVRNGYIELTRGPKENHARPAIDPLFRSAAASYGTRVVGVILTGNLDDGTAGLKQVKASGGVCIVQQPGDAYCKGMPESAIANVDVDYIVPLGSIPALLTAAVAERAEPSPEPREVPPDSIEIRAAELDGGTMDSQEFIGKPSIYTCPDCHGTLFEADGDGVLQFRCRVGHAYGTESLASGQREFLERALYAALRALEETASLADRLTVRHQDSQVGLSRKYSHRAEQDRQHAGVIRSLIVSGQSEPPVTDNDSKQDNQPGVKAIEMLP